MIRFSSSIVAHEREQIHEELDDVDVEEQSADNVLVQSQLLHDQLRVEHDVDGGENDDQEADHIEEQARGEQEAEEDQGPDSEGEGRSDAPQPRQLHPGAAGEDSQTDGHA